VWEDKPSGIAEWVQLRGERIARLLGLKRKSMPHHNTYRRILGRPSMKQSFEELAREHFRHCGEAGYQVVVALDGKVMRGTIDPPEREGLWSFGRLLAWGRDHPGTTGDRKQAK